jgi:hypothetical protein
LTIFSKKTNRDHSLFGDLITLFTGVLAISTIISERDQNLHETKRLAALAEARRRT